MPYKEHLFILPFEGEKKEKKRKKNSETREGANIVRSQKEREKRRERSERKLLFGILGFRPKSKSLYNITLCKLQVDIAGL